VTPSVATNRIAAAPRGARSLPGWAVYLRTMGLFCLAWYAAAALTPNKLLLPSPVDVALALSDSARDGELLQNASVSVARLLVSVACAALLAVPLGLVVGMSRTAEDLVAWTVELLRPISGIAWIPLALFIFGIGHALPIFIMFYTAFFPLLLGTAAGVRSLDRRFVPAARTMGVEGGTLLRRVVLPAALPAILTSARVAVASSWTAVVAAELVGAPSGLGYAIEYYRSMLATPSVMAFIFTIGFLGFLSDQALRLLTRALVPWAPAEARQ
jgi:ABC-type nitrate/sulfonate/bicarbonate transport system permease component